MYSFANDTEKTQHIDPKNIFFNNSSHRDKKINVAPLHRSIWRINSHYLQVNNFSTLKLVQVLRRHHYKNKKGISQQGVL